MWKEDVYNTPRRYVSPHKNLEVACNKARRRTFEILEEWTWVKHLQMVWTVSKPWRSFSDYEELARIAKPIHELRLRKFKEVIELWGNWRWHHYCGKENFEWIEIIDGWIKSFESIVRKGRGENSSDWRKLLTNGAPLDVSRFRVICPDLKSMITLVRFMSCWYPIERDDAKYISILMNNNKYRYPKKWNTSLFAGYFMYFCNGESFPYAKGWKTSEEMKEPAEIEMDSDIATEVQFLTRRVAAVAETKRTEICIRLDGRLWMINSIIAPFKWQFLKI